MSIAHALPAMARGSSRWLLLGSLARIDVGGEARRLGQRRETRGGVQPQRREQARQGAALQARSASTIHLSENSGVETRTMSRMARPASRNSPCNSAVDTRDSGERPNPNFPKVWVST